MKYWLRCRMGFAAGAGRCTSSGNTSCFLTPAHPSPHGQGDSLLQVVDVACDMGPSNLRLFCCPPSKPKQVDAGVGVANLTLATETGVPGGAGGITPSSTESRHCSTLETSELVAFEGATAANRRGPSGRGARSRVSLVCGARESFGVRYDGVDVARWEGAPPADETRG